MPAKAISIPKRKVLTRIDSSSLAIETVHLFLCEHTKNHEGPERPSDLLNSGSWFLVAETEDGAVAFVNRRQVYALTVSIRDEYPDGTRGIFGSGLDRQARVAISLDDGREVEGTVCYQLPEAHSRIQDYLNSPEPFLPLFRDDAVTFINKERITRLAPLPDREDISPYQVSIGSASPGSSQRPAD